MFHELLRYLLIAAALASVIYGGIDFPGSHMRSMTYVRRPKAWWWSPLRFFSDDEWTAEGLIYRRRFMGWCFLSAGLFVALMLVPQGMADGLGDGAVLIADGQAPRRLGQAGPQSMVYIGITLFLIGAIAELRDYLRGAWPTSLTWILMAMGLLLTASGLARSHPVLRRVAQGALVIFVMGIAAAWLLG